MTFFQVEFGRNALAELGRRMGMTAEVSPNKWPTIFEPVATVRGVFDGVAVVVQRFPRKHGYVDRAAAAVWPPLDLGLSVHLEGSVAGALRDWFGSVDVRTGDAAFDGPFRVQADEPDRVRALLGPEARRALLALAPTGTLLCSDLGVRCEAPTYQPFDWERGVPALVDLVRALRAHAVAVPVARSLAAWAPALQTVAAGYGLRTSTTPLMAEGSIGDLACGVFFRRLGVDRHAIELGAVVAPLQPLPLTVDPIHPRVRVEELELAEPADQPQAFMVGDPAFDQRFATRVPPAWAPRVAAALSPALRRVMVELLGHGDVGLRHGVLSIRRELTGAEPAQLRSWVDLAADGARAILGNAPGGYRTSR